MPASPIHVALFLTEMIDKNASYSVISATAYSIKWVHSLHNQIDPTNNSYVTNLLEAAKRLCSKPVNKKEPVTSESLIELCKKYVDCTDLLVLRDLAMILLSFSGFLRFDELINLRCNDVKFFSDYFSLYIRKRKTDQYRLGNEVVISKGTTEACPFSMLKRYFDSANLKNEEEMFLFQPCFRSKAFASLLVRIKRSVIRALENLYFQGLGK